ncbi:unnamed protein product, partial [Scytosiphon promiscuus]
SSCSPASSLRCSMSRFVKFATGLRDFGSDLNANISKALNIPKASEDPKDEFLEEARAGRVEGLNAVLEGSASVSDVSDALDESFLSPLCLACRGGHEEAALFLLRRADADPNNALGASRAAAAAAAVGQAYGNGADEDPAGVTSPPTPLALAVEAGLQRVVRELLARGARVDAHRAGDGWTALHLCAKGGNALVMKLLLGAPLADAGVRTSRLETPLSVACYHGHLSVVDMLLGGDGDEGSGAAGSSGGATDKDATIGGGGGGDGGGSSSERRSSTVLVAADAPAPPAAARGSRRHAEDRTWAGRTPLHRAALRGHTEVVLRLLAHGVTPDPADFRGATPLHLAACGGRWGAARELVRRGGASVTLTTADRDTVLHAAAWSAASAGSAERGVRLLLESGAEVDARNWLGSTALHLAAAAADHDSVRLLLAAGANPSAVNSCGLSPGTCFLTAPEATAPAAGSATAASQHVKELRQALREHRGRLGHIRRLADTSAKRVAVEVVADGATASVHRFVEFALKVQRWDLDARAHRARLRRLDKFRSNILCDSNPPAVAAQGHPLLLDMSPERESRAARAVEGRRKAAAEAIKGAKLALRDLGDWKKSVLAERGAVVKFMRRADPAIAFAAGASCEGSGGGRSWDGSDGGCGGALDAGPIAQEIEVVVVVADPAFLAAEGAGGWAGNEGGRGRRHASWTGTGDDTASSSESSPASGSATVDGGDAAAERPVRDRSGSRGSFGTRSTSGGGGGGGGGGRSRAPAAGFLRALGALDPCVSALREARSAAKSGDRLSMALETLRENVQATLIDLMDLETSIPGEATDSDGEEVANAGSGGGGGAGSVSALTAAEAGSLDVKVAGLVRRLSGKEVSGSSNAKDDDGNPGGGVRSPPSLASVYEGGLRGAAEASEAEVDTTESLTARALGMVRTAVAGPLLWALDDAFQRLVKADLDLRRLLPEAEALLGGAGSAEELAREARSRLVTVRQQVVDEQDLLKELVSKLKRRRRQAADPGEIRSIDDERLHVLARVSALRSAKLSELKALRRSGAYQRFPELLLEHPDPAESAFRTLLLGGIDVRDVDEWGEHHMTSVASVESASDALGIG